MSRASRSSRQPRSAAASGGYQADGAPWKAEWLVYYFINNASAPSFVIDVSEHYDVKQRALACHRSQFNPLGDGATTTRLTSPLFQQLVESRDSQFGALVRRPLGRRLCRPRARSSGATC